MSTNLQKATLETIFSSVRTEVLQRAALFQPTRHRLFLGQLGREDYCVQQSLQCTLPELLCCESDSQLLKEAQGEISYDQVISPLVILNRLNIKNYLQTLTDILDQGGWWLFATVIDGSYAELAKKFQQSLGHQPFLEMDMLIQCLTSERMGHPVIDCSRYILNYTSPQDAAQDFEKLSGQALQQERQPGNTEWPENGCHLEIAFGAVFITTKARPSLRPIHLQVQHEKG